MDVDLIFKICYHLYMGYTTKLLVKSLSNKNLNQGSSNTSSMAKLSFF